MGIGLVPLFIMCVLFVLFISGLAKHPIWAVAAYLIVYVIYNPDVWWAVRIGQFLPRPSLVAATVVGTAVLVHGRKLFWKVSRRECELYCFLAVCWLVSMLFGVGVHEEARTYLIKITKIFIFIFFFIRVVNCIKHFEIALTALMASGFFLALQSRVYGQFFQGRLDNFGGVDFNEANGFAAFLALCISFLGFQFLRMPWWARALTVLALAVLLDALIRTQSRSVFLGMALAVPVVLYRSSGKIRTQIGISVVLGAILFLTLTDSKYWERMQTIQSEEDAGRVGRLAFWRASVEIFKDHPLGVGVKNFQHMIGVYDPVNAGRDAHNSYVLCYSELGVLGIVLFLIIISEAVIQIRRIIRTGRGHPKDRDILFWAIPLEATFVIYLCGYMMTHSNLYTEMLWVLLAMPICLENAVNAYITRQSHDAISA